MNNQLKLEEYLDLVYAKYPEAFEVKNIKRLIWYVWKNYDQVVMNDQLGVKGFEMATSPESITRARRWVIEKNGAKESKAEELENEYHDHYLKR